MQGFTGTPATAGESENKQQMLLDLWGELVPERSEGPVGGAGGGLGLGGRPTHLLAGAGCRDHAQDPAFPPLTSEVAAAFWSFCILWVKLAPTAHACHYF